MKANEAPENLYLDTTSEYGDTVFTRYTRTDAFIEKAEEWLRNNQQGFILTDKDITDFINYMKGE